MGARFYINENESYVFHDEEFTTLKIHLIIKGEEAPKAQGGSASYSHAR